LVLATFVSLFVFGLKFGIEFTGGSNMEIEFSAEGGGRPSNEAIRDALSSFSAEGGSASGGDKKEVLIYSASDWPDQSKIKKTQEPWVCLEVICPSHQIGKLMDILRALNGIYVDTNYLTPERVIIVYEVPLRGVVANLYDRIKTVSQGYASMSYRIIGFRPGDLVKMEIWVAGHKEEAFSKIVDKNESYQDGKKMVEKLKDVLPPEQFSVALQAVIGGKVIARETISARRKDVTGYLYGGDVTRKRKLLEKQKKGKKLMKQKGRVNVPTKAFLEVFKA